MNSSEPLWEDLEERERFRHGVLISLGAAGSEVDEILGYGCSRFVDVQAPSLPLDDEPFVPAWHDYVEEAAERGAFAVLRDKLVQLRFPVRRGISRDPGYRAATLRGRLPGFEKTPLELNRPEGLKLYLHETPVGRIPVLIVQDRNDFSALLCALAKRNEPHPVPESMGATLISGLNNWDRIARYRRVWKAAHPAETAGGGWPVEFSRLVARKELYQDRLIILSEGGYSGVSGERLGMPDDEWLKTSRVIRLEHECVHYFTKRVFGSMNNGVHDEFIADYAGIAAAAGAFRSDWFFLFMGLEDFPNYRRGGRLQNYLGELRCDTRPFTILMRMVKEAAENVENFETRTRAASGSGWPARTDMLLALASLNLEELASTDGERLIEGALTAVRKRRAPNLKHP